jgi:prepilin-type N-terminal cleavage/methylation domain-containing protein
MPGIRLKVRKSIAPGRGFTLVELLVVIAIISILIGLMMPGIQSMRETARRTQCLSRMARLGEALQKDESANGALPPGSAGDKGPVHNVAKGIHNGWPIQLLPYLDDPALFKQIDQTAGVYDSKNAVARKIRIPAFACPSDRTVTGNDVPTSSYAGCHNDVEAPIDEKNNGVLYLNSRISQHDVTDGPEHTFYIGEKVTDAGDLGWMSGTRATLRNAGTPLNGPFDAAKATGLTVGGFGSMHPGGGNFLFGDYAFRFVSNAIDTQVYQQLANRADGQLLTSGPTREE